MEELNFRVLHISTEVYKSDNETKTRLEPHMILLKTQLESCGLKDVSINFLKVKKSDDEDFPEIEELVFQVTGKYPTAGYKRDKPYCYREFLNAWRSLFYPKPSPIVVLHENNSFLRGRRSVHTHVSYQDIAFGVLPYNGEFHQYSSLQQNSIANYNTHIDFFHDTRNMKIKYKDKELILSYENIRNIFVNINSFPTEVFFDLCNPPLIFKIEERRSRYIGSYTISHRTTNLDALDVDLLGRSNILRISIKDEKVEEILSRIHFRCSEKPIHYAHIVTVQKPKPRDLGLDISHFGCTYLMTAIFRRNFTMVAQAEMIDGCVTQLNRMCLENAESLEKALTLVLAAVDAGKVINYWHAIGKQYIYYLENKDEINYAHYVVPEKCRMIRRITLTPTRQLLWAPEIMFGNRVLRNFDSEYAVRVALRDDNNSRLSFNAAYADESVFDLSIRRPLSAGVSIGRRSYDFLAWSNSQIRDHGIWMYARDQEGKTAADIRLWMGDFSHIHSVPKYMARMGQCFSQTEDALKVPLEDNHVRTENDVEGGYDHTNGKPYCFSDGVGKISVGLAKKVHNALGHDKLCSAFQIRYGGCKGMLVIDPTLKDTDIVFRKSMKKFDSPENISLEIAKTSAPIGLQLNRPFITILNDMGVRHRTFLRLQEDMLRNLTDMLFDEEKAAAFLESKTPNQLFSYKELSRSGVHLTTESFFRSLLLALHRHHIEKIKSRANIAIDPSKGRNMLGVMDETGVLREGEVFVQYTKDLSYGETTRDTIVLQREVLVTKNPCLLPGDVRKFRAVDVPQLRHIVDCIVFPQKGSRPHPNEMAGSDLDGDEYAVLWQDDLIFYQRNHTPGQFPSAPESYQPDIRVTNMIEFLVTYIKNDQVGTIANTHLAHADARTIFDPICVKIANKFSFAVDYAKTGVSKHLDRDERPGQFPDFMEKNHKEVYRSTKALGKMYRVACDYEAENEQASIAYQDIQVDEDLIFPGWENYKQDAIKSRNKFNTLLKTVLRNYGIQHEAEVFSGAFTNLHCRFQERKDRDEIEKVVVRCIKRLSKSMNDEFLEEFENSGNINQIDVAMLRKASAWYVVTYSDNDAKFLSFPWTVSKYLAAIKIRRNDQPLLFSPIVEKMNKKIIETMPQLPYPTDHIPWQRYDFICSRNTVELALRVLILWAQDEGIIQKPGRSTQGLLFPSKFNELFLHIAESASYIVQKGEEAPVVDIKSLSAASLCLEFFRFCLTLRFFTPEELRQKVPFQLFKYTNLSKRAVVSYHMFAVLGKFQTLYFDVASTTENIVQMKTIQIDSKVFPSIPISQESLKSAQDALVRYSQVEYVELREIRQTKKVAVSAEGSEESLKVLKRILNKKHVHLKQLFSVGVLPED